MNYNFHPLIVHFPVAFFTLYASLELLSILKFFKKPYWFYLKAVLIILGVISAGFAIITGEIIEKNFDNVRSLVELHSRINKLAVSVFFIIAFSYLIEWLRKEKIKILPKQLMDFAVQIKNLVLDTALIYVFSLVGLFLIIVAAALGGAIAYGKDVDPFVSFIYYLFMR